MRRTSNMNPSSPQKCILTPDVAGDWFDVGIVCDSEVLKDVRTEIVVVLTVDISVMVTVAEVASFSPIRGWCSAVLKALEVLVICVDNDPVLDGNVPWTRDSRGAVCRVVCWVVESMLMESEPQPHSGSYSIS